MAEPRHVSVLLHECIDNLNIDPEGVYVDGTLPTKMLSEIGACVSIETMYASPGKMIRTVAFSVSVMRCSVWLIPALVNLLENVD